MKLLFVEFRKLLSKPVFLLLILFLAAVVLVRFFMSCEELDYVAIAKEFGCSSRTIKRRVEKLKGEGSEE